METWVFPLGWTLDGVGPCLVEEGLSYCVLLLDDTAAVPTGKHQNMAGDLPLLIVPHRSSGRHLDLAHKLPEADLSAFKSWGLPCLCSGFSHEPGGDDEMYQNILNLFQNPSSSAQFFAQRQNEEYLRTLDNLAAICQIKMINQHQNITEADTVMANSLSRLDLAFCNKFEEKKNEGSWESCLQLIQDKARSLA